MVKGFTPALMGLQARQDSSIDYNSAPPNLSTLANNSLFETWRPRAHVLPPSNHIGDPCMHYVDPTTGLFHVGFLYSSDNSSGAAGATTDNFVTYRDLNPGEDPTFIRPGGINDPIAVFDGSVIPFGISGTPTLFYTSVSYLPIHWTVPYIKGAETASLATSSDGGKNFTKVNHGPSIPGAPQGSLALNVTGFRDPYVFQNPLMDSLLESKNGTWYSVISGGVHDSRVSQFLYRQYDAEFRDWEYLNEWWKEPENSTWGDGTWAGRWGFNMEVANIFTLSSDGYGNEDVATDFFHTIGTEGGIAPVASQTSPNRDMLWANGEVSKSANGSIHFKPFMAGFLDAGRNAYAAAGKLVPSSSQPSRKSGTTVDRFISYLWLTSNDYGQSSFPDAQQGWDGTLLTPRELSKGTIENVVGNDLSLETGASWRVTGRDNRTGTVQLTTLHQRIVREAYAAFTSNATIRSLEPGRIISAGSIPFTSPPASKFFLMKASLSFPSSTRNSSIKAGFKILQSEYESTSVYYQWANETLIIDRANSSATAATTPGILTSVETGKLRLFDIANASVASGCEVEKLELTIIVDNGIVEVWANDRFVISAWVWSWYASSTGTSFFVEGDEEVEYSDVQIWEGLVDAWPERSA